MKLSKRSKRNIATFNRIKYTPSQSIYSAKRLAVESKTDTFVDAYLATKEAKSND